MNEKAKMLLTALSENRITLKLAFAYMDSPLEGEALKAILDAHKPSADPLDALRRKFYEEAAKHPKPSIQPMSPSGPWNPAPIYPGPRYRHPWEHPGWPLKLTCAAM